VSAAQAGLQVMAALRIEAWYVRRGLPEDAWVERSGMGWRKAKRAAERMAANDARAIVVAGVCGAIDPSLVPGDVVVASELFATGIHVVLGDTQPLVRALERLGHRVREGPMICTERLLPPVERDKLAESRAIAVDMETAWLAAGARGRPFSVFRVVSDGPGHEIWSPGILKNGLRALRVLRDGAPALLDWFEQVAGPAAASERAC
jgi:4-hydroxy-3-methylbut-2-enyl diphosphate reductase